MITMINDCCTFCSCFSHREDTGLDDVFDKSEEVVLAAQGPREVSTTMHELIDLANSNCRTTTSLTEAQAAAVRDAFACVVCTGPFFHIFSLISNDKPCSA